MPFDCFIAFCNWRFSRVKLFSRCVLWNSDLLKKYLIEFSVFCYSKIFKKKLTTPMAVLASILEKSFTSCMCGVAEHFPIYLHFEIPSSKDLRQSVETLLMIIFKSSFPLFFNVKYKSSALILYRVTQFIGIPFRFSRVSLDWLIIGSRFSRLKKPFFTAQSVVVINLVCIDHQKWIEWQFTVNSN